MLRATCLLVVAAFVCPSSQALSAREQAAARRTAGEAFNWVSLVLQTRSGDFSTELNNEMPKQGFTKCAEATPDSCWTYTGLDGVVTTQFPASSVANGKFVGLAIFNPKPLAPMDATLLQALVGRAKSVTVSGDTLFIDVSEEEKQLGRIVVTTGLHVKIAARLWSASTLTVVLKN